MKIAIITDESRESLVPLEEARLEDHQKNITSESILRILSKKYECIRLSADDSIIENLKREEIDLVFNLCNGIRGNSKLAQIPALLEFAGIPYTGSAVLGHAIAINKIYSSTVFKSAKIPTPDFVSVYTMEDLTDVEIEFPVIVKPSDEGSSRGIYQDSLVFNREDLLKKVEESLSIYNPPIMVNQFIEGREFSVGVFGNGEDVRILPIQEIDLSMLPDNLLKFYSFEIKSYYKSHTKYHIPAILSDQELKDMEKVVLKAYNSLLLRDYARVDVILKDGIPYVLEINSLPGLMEKKSALYRMAEATELGYEGFINSIVDSAIKRYDLK